MSCTLTLVAGPTAQVGMKTAVYAMSFDGYYLAGGEPIDVSSEFDTVFAVIPAGVDALADGAFVFAPVFDKDAAVSASNVLMAVYWSADGTDGEVLKEVANDSVDLAGIGELKLVVIGR